MVVGGGVIVCTTCISYINILACVFDSHTTLCKSVTKPDVCDLHQIMAASAGHHQAKFLSP